MRKLVPRQRKHKARAREKQHEVVRDSNIAELPASSQAEKEERKLKLKEDLRSQQSKVSGRKQKRLDKYIDSKLKFEEKTELIKKLSQTKVDTGLLQSSKSLARRNESKQGAISRALQERDAEINVKENEQLPRIAFVNSDSESDSSYDDDHLNEENPNTRALSTMTKPPASFGSGLKRPLAVDVQGNPIIKTRKTLEAQEKPSMDTRLNRLEDVEWEGFSSAIEDGAVNLSNTISGQRHRDTEKAKGGLVDERAVDDRSRYSSSELSNETQSEIECDSELGDRPGYSESLEKEGTNKDRVSAFKAWATQNRNNALGFAPSTTALKMPWTEVMQEKSQHDTSNHNSTVGSDYKYETRVANKINPNQDELPLSTKPRTIFNVPVNRVLEIEETRRQLPVVAEEQRIMEVLQVNDCIIICGATGSGKTTQVPQFLFEAGYGSPDGPTPGMVGITQPRRVAAVSMAKRVATELGKDHEDEVAHQIRFDSSVNRKTAIKFMTDGILLHEIALDFSLSRYSAIIIDEAHERTVNTDLLIGMLSRIVDTRSELAQRSSKHKPLKLVIMSATLRAADFTKNSNLFRRRQPPIVEIEGRQHPVTIHFTRRTQSNYEEDTFQKVSRGHRKLPQGGILVFLTGESEIFALLKRLRQDFIPTEVGSSHPKVHMSPRHVSFENEDMECNGNYTSSQVEDSDNETTIRGLDNDSQDSDDHGFEIGEGESELLKVHVLPLYSQLPTELQIRVFEPPPDGSRLIVLATNVAETSLTIPGIRYVFDCGRAKERKLDKNTGVQKFDIGWISKANANQRAGRAGRTGPGHCYRLYSSAVYERDFFEFPEPEIRRTPLEGVILQLKSMGVPRVTAFPFPTSPDRTSLMKAEKLLECIGALVDGKITATGKELALYPLSPRLSRMLLEGQKRNCMPHSISLAAALAVPDLLVSENQLDLKAPVLAEGDIFTEADSQRTSTLEKRRRDYHTFHGHLARLDQSSDAVKLLTILYDYGPEDIYDERANPFLRTKAVLEAHKLRQQLIAMVLAHYPGSVDVSRSKLKLPAKAHIKTLRYIVAAGYIDQVAIRADLSPNPPESMPNTRRAINVPYVTLFPSSGIRDLSGFTKDDHIAQQKAKYVYIHPSSVLARTSPEKLPQYVVYSHLSQPVSRSISSGEGAATTATPTKIRLHPLTPITADELLALAEGTTLIDDGKPIGKIEALPREHGEERRVCWVTSFLKGESGTQGWPLPPARKVVQRRDVKRGWTLEKLLS